jgi:trk system potassium uptake protein TrkA
MYVIVIGGGKVGYFLARELMQEMHEVLVIEQDSAKCERIAEELGDIVLRGDGCEATTAELAGFGRADMVIAVTGDDEDNLVSCQLAKTKFSVPRTVARLNNPKNEKIFRLLGIDTTVSATAAILAQIEQELPTHQMIPLLKLKTGLELVGVKIPPDAKVIGKELKDLLLPHGTLLVLMVGKDGGTKVPSGDSTLQAEDEVVAVTRPENEEALRVVLTEP